MSRAFAGALVVVAALVLLAALFLLRPRPTAAPEPRVAADGAPGTGSAPHGGEAFPPPPALLEERRKATLWLPAPGGWIAPAEVEVASAPEPGARVEALIGALLATAPVPPLAPLFDTEVKLVATLRGPDATLYVDLTSSQSAEPPPSGSELELQRVYSIVHTVVENEPSIERVVLLWNGVQRPSFAGHVDTGRPLVPRPSLVAPAAGAPGGQDASDPAP